VFALQAMTKEPKALLLVDEPEISLHPQAQRALVGLIRKLPNQSIVATHSSNILDRADPRTLLRLHRDATSVVAKKTAALTDDDATWLVRFANPLTTEACFARKVILVEGYSDRIVLQRLARRLGRDLDAEGVSVLSLDGGSGVGAHIALLGKTGLDLGILGLCDEDKEELWIKEVSKAGIPVSDRASLGFEGFFVCVRDLEQEFIRALGIAAVQALIAAENETSSFAKFAAQPAHSGAPLDEQLRRFLHGRNVRWAAPLADAIDLKTIPGPLNDLFSRL
jgi:predicted ATP-dependent endonuclease of OLD family